MPSPQTPETEPRAPRPKPLDPEKVRRMMELVRRRRHAAARTPPRRTH
jgi:hypothetical protein